MRTQIVDRAIPRPAPRRWRLRHSCLAGVLALIGCQPSPEMAHMAVQPQTAPVRTITSFNEALRCMDELFLAQGKKDIYITSAGIPDATGLIAAGTKEMLITAISKMSATSGAFRFVDYDPTQLDVQVLSELVGLREEFRRAELLYPRRDHPARQQRAESRPRARASRCPARSGDLARPGRLGRCRSTSMSASWSRGRSCRACRRATRSPWCVRQRRRCRRPHRQGRPVSRASRSTGRKASTRRCATCRAVDHRGRSAS